MKLEAGAQVEFESVAPITAEQLRAYADASGDFNPIHLDEVAARKAGLPGIIAHGMLSSAFLAERARKFAAGSGWELKAFQSRFKAMVMLGDQLSVGGAVKEISDGSLTLELQARNQRGEVVTTGLAQFRQG